MLHRVVFILVIVISEYLVFGGREQGIIFRDDDKFHSTAERVIDSGCSTPHGGRGKCVSILECPELLALISKPDQKKFLRQSQCGWIRDLPIVCCGDESSKNRKQNCTISDLHWCESGKFDECCIPKLTYNINEVTANTLVGQLKNKAHCEMSSIPPEPESGCCGLQTTIPNKLPGEATLIDQYPWTAIIEYAGNGTTQMKCGGSLVSSRYVLTAAHCLNIDNWAPTNIRLGDYDIEHPGKDCVNVENGDEDCTEGAVTIPIENSIPHPDYILDSRAQTNDIALIRMQDNAPYTDFIRPICLPSLTSDFTESAESSISLHVVGWGLTRDALSISQLKQQLELPFVNAENCFIGYRRKNILLDDGHICAGAEKGKNPCKGDSGGALMLVNNQRTDIVGIASFSSCGRTNKPAVYTKVLYYLPWIRRVIS